MNRVRIIFITYPQLLFIDSMLWITNIDLSVKHWKQLRSESWEEINYRWAKTKI